jgi:N-acetylglucosaminyldiphosphoundecaprenol N-acetyl-beta-D-mannosaminyltransferase
MPIERPVTRFVDVDFTDLDWHETVAALAAAALRPSFTTVVTPNVDHIVRMDKLAGTALGKRYADAARDADYCLCDSRILARLAQLRGITLPVVPGSDLTAAIFADHLNAGDRIAIVGGDENTIADLAPIAPDIEIVHHMPPMGMIDNETAMDVAARFIRDAKARFIFVAVGSPQGEILLHRARQVGAKAGVALSIGASIDFLTGRQTRAPRIVQRLGFEWAYRLLGNPKRLWRRYLVDGPRIFAIVMRRGGL